MRRCLPRRPASPCASCRRRAWLSAQPQCMPAAWPSPSHRRQEWSCSSPPSSLVWVNHTPTGATLVRLVFPFAAFHLVVLIDVADVEPASTAHRVGRLPVSGAVQYVIVGTAVERVGGSFPPEFVTSIAPAHRAGTRTPYSFVLPRATSHQVPPVPAVEPRVGSVSTVNHVNPDHRVDNVRSALPVDPVLARRAVHRIRPVPRHALAAVHSMAAHAVPLASVSSIAQAIEPIT